jgi:DNA-directed RNA polymerase specialized sigma24 family protein
MLIDDKIGELTDYIPRLCANWDVYRQSYGDIVNSVLVRLYEENAQHAFTEAKALFGRCTNITREEIAKLYAEALLVSGVSFQAHQAARRRLKLYDGDIEAAYADKTITPRISRELLAFVAHSASYVDVQTLTEAPPTYIEDSDVGRSQRDDSIRAAIHSLPPDQAAVVRAYFYSEGGTLSLSGVARELGKTDNQVRGLWKNAKKNLYIYLEDVV